MVTDPWLQRWLLTLSAAAADSPVLEIGCGSGADTAVLTRSGLRVVAFDISPEAVTVAQQAAPAASITAQSVEDAFPLEGSGIGAIVASLSLHYFTWPMTLDLMGRVHATLRTGGVFLCRVNSSEDKNFGATGHPEIEPGLYDVGGQQKRFFNETDITALFGGGWRMLSKEHVSTVKYGPPKFMWEVVAERLDPFIPQA